MLTDKQAQKIRSRFPIFQRKIYLNSCSQGALSDAVQRGLEDFIASWHEQGSPWELWVSRYEAARTAFAQFINASPDEVAIVTSVSAGINSVASALSFRERNKVVLGEFEFPTMGHVWLAQRARGAEVQFVAAEGNRIPATNYERFVDRNTSIVPLTRVCFRNGFRSDVNAIVKIAHSAGALVMLDDYQDSGTRPIDVKALDVDFFVTGTLKYLLGPPGVAFMYVRKELTSSLVPTLTGWFAQTNPFTFDSQTIDLSPTARRFQSGTPSVPNLYAAVPGFELLREIGMEDVAEHIKRLTQSLLSCALDMGIRVKTPGDSTGPLLVLSSKDSTLLVQKLAESGIVVSNRHDGLRIAFHIYNTMDDVKAVAEALEKNINLMVLDPAGVGSYD
jgi:selenocysteine lyase/cysteine desulfurase